LQSLVKKTQGILGVNRVGPQRILLNWLVSSLAQGERGNTKGIDGWGLHKLSQGNFPIEISKAIEMSTGGYKVVYLGA
jgi:hypothetical protein